jgi:flavin reductase (DIM6/NTAB) family NADH-FMN oxidoreductase RutF
MTDLGAAFRQGMSHLASGVAVLCATDTECVRHAMTASSVTSVSDSPPSLLVCVNKSSKMNQVLSSTQPFVVNILARQHEQISNRCARPSEPHERFEIGNWVQDQASGLYYLADVPTVFFCEKALVVCFATHDIYIANITKILIAEKIDPLLVYAKRGYHSV